MPEQHPEKVDTPVTLTQEQRDEAAAIIRETFATAALLLGLASVALELIPTQED